MINRSNPLVAELLEMLSYARPAGSAMDRAFVSRYLLTLPRAYQDRIGNVIIPAREGDESRILWSAHTDTVDRVSGRKGIRMDRAGIVSLSGKAKRAKGGRFGSPFVLGADDTAGCFILRQMALRNVPGTYIFHFSEETGGIGSRALADEYPLWLQQFTHAIAIDRQGTGDIVTHQYGGRTASDAFACDLARALRATSNGILQMTPERGIFTDTAHYEGLIAECSNLSAGYQHAHSSNETLDAGHVLTLLESLSALDTSDLQTYRMPGEDDPIPSSWLDSYTGRSATLDSITIDMTEDEINALTDDEVDAINAGDSLPAWQRARDRSLYLDPDMSDILETLARRYQGVRTL